LNHFRFHHNHFKYCNLRQRGKSLFIMFSQLAITFINFVWIKSTIDTNWINCYLSLTGSGNCDSV
jgi:hypothetical protein